MESMRNRPIRIGDLEIGGRIFLAPMAGITDSAMRVLCKRMGCDFTYSEMISAKGMYYGKKSYELLKTREEERPIGAQIFGSDEAIMAEMAQRIEREYAGQVGMIDINMGCPARKIVKNGEGGALMKDIGKAKRIIEAVAEAVRVPVTVKFRRGFEDEDMAEQMARAAEQAGAAAICIHGRTVEQQYAGKADWDCIRRAKKAVGIPVIGNGDITSLQEAERRMEETGCDAVMIGRAAFGNPWVFSGYKPQAQEIYETAKEHLDMQIDWMGERNAVPLMRKHFCAYAKGFGGAAQARAEIVGAKSRAELLERLKNALKC